VAAVATLAAPLVPPARASTLMSGPTGFLGDDISLSGGTGLVGAANKDSGRGAAYLYRNLDTAAGAVTENVEIRASSRSANDYFGRSVALEGDTFAIAGSLTEDRVYSTGNLEYGDIIIPVTTGKVFVGSVKSVTTLDDGNTSKTISGISFVSRED
jgi:hypothetical protein